MWCWHKYGSLETWKEYQIRKSIPAGVGAFYGNSAGRAVVTHMKTCIKCGKEKPIVEICVS